METIFAFSSWYYFHGRSHQQIDGFNAFATKLISLYTILTTLDSNGLDFINTIDNIQDQIYNILYVILPDIYSLSNNIDFVWYMHVEPLSHFPPHWNRLLNNISDEFARFIPVSLSRN